MGEAPAERRRLWTITNAGLNGFGREFRDVIEPGIAGTTNSPRSVTWWAVPRIPAYYGSDGTVDLGVIARHSRIRALSPARHLRLPNCLGSSSNMLWCCKFITLSYILGYNGLIPSFASAAFRQPSALQESELGLHEEENSRCSSANFQNALVASRATSDSAAGENWIGVPAGLILRLSYSIVSYLNALARSLRPSAYSW